jgi:hypothetical protein
MDHQFLSVGCLTDFHMPVAFCLVAFVMFFIDIRPELYFDFITYKAMHGSERGQGLEPGEFLAFGDKLV